MTIRMTMKFRGTGVESKGKELGKKGDNKGK